MNIKDNIEKYKYNLKHFLLKLKVRLDCYKKYLVLDKKLREISNNTDNETKIYWKKLQKKYAFQMINMEFETQYDYWLLKNDLTYKDIINQRKIKFEKNPKISIITPLYKTKTNFFRELLYFLEQQTYENWELCLADGSPEPLTEIQSMIKNEKRIKYKFLDKNNGIAENTNEALKLATGDFIALMDHDDVLTIDCLFENVKAINDNSNVQFLFSDEDKIYEIGKKRFGAHFKPDFAIDTLRSENYICHFSVIRKDIMDKLEGERCDYDGAQDFDLVLRMSEVVEPINIIHIPKILYHWRLSETSTAANADAKPYAYISGEKAVKDHLMRMGLKASVNRNKHFGLYDSKYFVKDNPKVNILIISKDEPEVLDSCIKSIIEKTTYENYEIDIIDNCSKDEKILEYYKKIVENFKVKILYYKNEETNNSKLINYGIENTDGEFILQLDGKIKVIEPTWLEDMLGVCQRNDVGVVGAKILYSDNTIFHAGIILGIGDSVGFIHRGLNDNETGFFARAIIRQDVSAVCKECLLTKRKIYEEVGKINEEFVKSFNDIDFCLKVRKKNYLVVYEPMVKLYYLEEKDKLQSEEEKKDCKLFQNIWQKELEKGDPYYNKNLDLNSTDCLIRTDKV